jgi:hypothetical protein
LGHHMLAHRRAEAYRLAAKPAYPAGGGGPPTLAGNEAATRDAKRLTSRETGAGRSG